MPGVSGGAAVRLKVEEVVERAVVTGAREMTGYTGNHPVISVRLTTGHHPFLTHMTGAAGLDWSTGGVVALRQTTRPAFHRATADRAMVRRLLNHLGPI